MKKLPSGEWLEPSVLVHIGVSPLDDEWVAMGRERGADINAYYELGRFSTEEEARSCADWWAAEAQMATRGRLLLVRETV